MRELWPTGQGLYLGLRQSKYGRCHHPVDTRSKELCPDSEVGSCLLILDRQNPGHLEIVFHVHTI